MPSRDHVRPRRPRKDGEGAAREEAGSHPQQERESPDCACAGSCCGWGGSRSLPCEASQVTARSKFRPRITAGTDSSGTGCSRAVPLGRRAPRGRVVPQLPRQGLQGQGAAPRGRRGQTRTHIRASEDPPPPHPPLPLPKRAEHGAVGGGACPQPAPAASPLFPDGAIANSGTRWLPSYFFLLSSSFLSFNFYCNTKATIKKAKPNRQS